MNEPSTNSRALDQEPLATLREIVRRFQTPTYAYDLSRLRAQVHKLRAHLPDEVDILYSLKANASLGISDVMAECGLGADVASAGELATAVEAGFPARQIFVAGPYKSPETMSLLRSLPEAVVSIDSRSEWSSLNQHKLTNRAVIRLRPDFESAAVVAAGSESRFGVPPEELPQCRDLLAESSFEVIGFHVFAGSQVLDAAGVIRHMRGAIDLSLRAADTLGLPLKFVNLGGGFGIPYAADEEELDLASVGEELESLVRSAAPTRLALELGRYLVAPSGWYLTSVVGHQTHQGRTAVVTDGGTHQRADLCGLDLCRKANPPQVLDVSSTAPRKTDVLGCLSLPADVLASDCPLPPLVPGNILAFANAGAYGLWSSPTMFHGNPLPAEVALDGTKMVLMRARQPAAGVLEGQSHVVEAKIRAARSR